MPKLKAPAPPLPKALLPTPGRPGQAKGPTVKDAGLEAGISVVDWVDERTSLSGGMRWMMFRKIPKGTNWFYTLGSSTLFALLSQAVTGVFLAMYYDPSPTRAYESTRYISNEAFLGEFVRGMHKWGSTVMVVLIFLHMARTFFFGAYKYPRELNWVIGVVLLILTMAMSFTGYLLPFDQRSYWATIVGVNINGTGPIVGPYLSDFLRAGPEFGATTLTRFYAIHMLLIPGALAALTGAHLYLVAKLGTTAPPWIKDAGNPSLHTQTLDTGLTGVGPGNVFATPSVGNGGPAARNGHSPNGSPGASAAGDGSAGAHRVDPPGGSDGPDDGAPGARRAG